LILDVAFLPSEVGELKGSLCILIDVLRATSTIVTLLERGCKGLFLVKEVEQARELARKNDDFLLCGERGGLPPPGFDYGNSPYEFSRLQLEGEQIVLTTTNGTRAAECLLPAEMILVGSFLNGEACVSEAKEKGKDIVIVCAGREMAFVMDDAVCAGFLADILLNEDGVTPTDSAKASHRLFRSYYPNILKALEDSSSGRSLIKLGLEADLKYCAQLNINDIVPKLIYRSDGLIEAILE